VKKYFNKHYWLRKILVNKFTSKFINQNLTNKLVFNSIYKSNYWNKSKEFDPNIQSLSGPGSIPNSIQTNHLLKELENFFRNNNVKKILDAPCGDCAWISKFFDTDINYTGIDIVNDLIKQNKLKYEKNNIKFYCRDISQIEQFDDYDFILMRDFFIHLPTETIKKILINLKNSKCKFFAFNNYEGVNLNKDIATGQHRKINVLEKPFNLNEPYHKILELKNYNFPDKDLNDNFLYIYKN